MPNGLRFKMVHEYIHMSYDDLMLYCVHVFPVYCDNSDVLINIISYHVLMVCLSSFVNFVVVLCGFAVCRCVS